MFPTGLGSFSIPRGLWVPPPQLPRRPSRVRFQRCESIVSGVQDEPLVDRAWFLDECTGEVSEPADSRLVGRKRDQAREVLMIKSTISTAFAPF